MRSALAWGLLLILPSALLAADPKSKPADCNWSPNASNCLRNHDPDYRNCYRGSSPREIVAACTAWVIKDPLDMSAYITLGGQYRGLGDYDSAIAAYTKAIAARPKFPYAYFDRGLAWEMKGEKARAVADYQKCLELAPRFPRALEGLKRLGVKDV
jgi:tetratricopeptide (TPR) repeat protein